MALTTIPSELSSVSGISDSSTSTAITINSSQEVTFAGNITTGSNTISGVLSSVTGSLGSAATATTQAASDNTTKIATTAYVTTALANMVDSAPGTLNTLNELAAALGDDANFSTTVTNSIATKLPLAGGTMTGDIISQDNRGIKFGTGSDTAVYNDGSNFYIKNNTVNQDIIFQGNDDGATGTTVLTLDMSNAGAATFNSFIYLDYIRGKSDNNTGINIAGSDVLAFQTGGTERMRIDSGGDLILAANATGAALIKGVSGDQTDRNTGGYPQYTFVGNEGTGIRRPSSNVLAFDTGGAEAMRIDSSGDITQTFADGSNVTAGNMPSITGYTLTNTTNSNGSGAKLEFSLNNGSAKAAIAAEQSATTSSSLNFYTENSGTFAEAMRIDSSGNVGIGAAPDTTNYGGTFRYFGVDGGAGYAVIEGQTSSVTAGDGAASFFASTTGTSGLNLLGGMQVYNYASSASNAEGGLKFFTASGGSIPVRMTIDSSGRLLIAKTSTAFGTVGHELDALGQISATADGRSAVYLNRLNSDGNLLQFHRDGTEVGTVVSRSGVISSFVFDPRANGSGLSGGTRQIQPTNENGAVVDNILDIGSGTTRFQDIYATNGTIQTSDRNEKQDIEELSDAEQRVAVAAKGLLRKFRWKSAVEEKGDDARIHFGIIAQDLQDAFTAEGLDAGRYAMFISSTWTDEETGEERTRLGVRYSELLAFIISALKGE